MRFSAHHAPQAPRRRFWILVAIVFALLALPVVVVNLSVDPFDFRLVPHRALIRENITRKDDTMLWAAGEIRRLPQQAMDKVTLVVVGDSRTDTLCRWPGSPRIFRLGKDVVLNLSVGGATLIENVKLLETDLPRLPKLRAVLFSAPIERVGVGDLDRADNALRLSGWPPLYAFSLGIFASSLDMLGEQADGKKNGWIPQDRPDIDPKHLPDPGKAGLDVAGNNALGGKSVKLPKSEQIAAANWRSSILRLDPARLDKRARELIGPIAARLRARGIQLVFFFPPLHPDVTAGIEPRITELQRPLIAYLSQWGPVENFSLTTPDGIVPVFADSMHLQQDVAHAVLADVYQRTLAPAKR
ncbi:MAG TPA: hypothetical protein VNB29_09100 [Chthoniobacterales bacterium]|nr:hypothetical protein [Chthoniobacterales bacterium]